MNSPGKALLVCSTGGHLAQLYRLSRRLDVTQGERLWVTFDTPQSRSLLADEEVIFVRYTAPRDYANVMRNSLKAVSILRSQHFEAVVSTGSGLALSFIPLARAMRIPAIYIESAARSTGPSLTGRALTRLPGVKRFTQYPYWADKNWTYIGSVFEGFEVEESPIPTSAPERIVVTLGTIEGFGFRRLIRKVQEIAPAGAEILWQVGDTDTTGLEIDAVRSMPASELDEYIRNADAVIAHSGIGSALAALDAGKCPILVPRLAEHNEHVDDHQVQIAAELAGRGLALHRTVDALSEADLTSASKRSVFEIPGSPIKTG